MNAMGSQKCIESGRPVICIQGLGFVGAAMAVAVANADDDNGNPWFDVIGVDLPTDTGLQRTQALNRGEFPFETNDPKLVSAVKRARKRKNFIAVTESEVFALAEVTVVDVHLDIDFSGAEPVMHIDSFRRSIHTLGEHMQSGALVLVETTIPPGTCENVVVPELAVALKKRALDQDGILVAHSYERVMPGLNYFDSIVNFWRVYAGHTTTAADACESFLSKVINFKEFPPKRLQSTIASETGKVLENSYRAVNIAFINEWGRFAEAVGIDLFEVIDAIRVRPTHNNIRQPGFGVGGYCLTKDPLFAPLAAKAFFGLDSLSFPLSTQGLEINSKMPMATVEQVRDLLGGSLMGKRILLCGVSYRPDVGDTRYSPSETFVVATRAMGAEVRCHDPIVQNWEELGETVLKEFPCPLEADAIVFAVAHKEYKNIDFRKLGDCIGKTLVFDANKVLTGHQRAVLRSMSARTASIGRGEKK